MDRGVWQLFFMLKPPDKFFYMVNMFWVQKNYYKN